MKVVRAYRGSLYVHRASVNKQPACCRSCRGHSKAGPQVAELQHDETVAQQDVTPHEKVVAEAVPIPKQARYILRRATRDDEKF